MAKTTPSPLLLSRLSLRQLFFLSAVAENGSILQASRKLNMTQPAVSRAILELERHLDQDLFVRLSKGVQPTPAGEILLRHARTALAELRTAAEEIDDLNRGHRGRLSIGTLPNGAAGPLPTALLRFREARPEVALTVTEGLYRPMAANLRAGDLDILVGRIGHRSDDDGLETQPLYLQRWVVHAGAANPVVKAGVRDLAALMDIPWILPARQAPIRPMVENFFQRCGLSLPANRMEMSALGITRTILLESDAVMFLPTGTFRADVQRGDIVELSLAAEQAVEEVGLFWRAGSERRALELSFVAALQDACVEMGLPSVDMRKMHIK